jgi:c-Rel proto-oncogene protein
VLIYLITAGFKHRDDVKSMDLSAVRLCFQVVIEGEVPGQFSVVLNPVVSDPIYNRRTIPEPQIHRLSHCNCYADGGKPDIILLCTRVRISLIGQLFGCYFCLLR